MNEFLDTRLNEMQKRAVISDSQNILVTAGAGSGKTRVLTERIINLINCKFVHPSEILAITFTNKASNVMKERLNEKGLSTTNMWISTFHSCCVRILRENAERISGYNKSFTIFDEQDKSKVISDLLKQEKIESDDYKKKLSFHISHFKNKYQTLAEYERENAFERGIDEIVRLIKVYEEKLKENNAFDFDDLLFKTYKLLLEDEEVRNHYSSKFKHILVDEFQDTNEIQYDLIKLLAGEHTNVFVVGDEDQCIYSWRGANYRNIANFTKDFENVEIIKLEQNYRSTKRIIEGANKIISKNFERIDKKLWTDNEEGLKIEYKSCYNESEEADFVASTIYNLSKTHSEHLNDIAVLVRLNSLTRNIEEKLLNYGINYKVYGGMKFYDRAEIKNFLAYLKVLNNPKDDVSFSKIANFPKRGIGEASLENLKNLDSTKSMLENLLELNSNSGLKGATFNKLYGLKLLFEDLLKKTEELDIDELATYIIEKIGLENYLNVVEEDKNRMLNIEQLVLSIKEYTKNNPNCSLSDYLQSVTLVSDIDSYSDKDESVTIATVHASKGLEFECVFVIGLEDGIFPLKRNDDCDEEEERRLMYVAVTRSMKRLYLTNAKNRFMYGYTRHEIVSPYIKDLGFEQSYSTGFVGFGPSAGFGGYNNSRFGENYSSAGANKQNYHYDSGVSDFARNDYESVQSATEIKVKSSNSAEFCVGDKVKHRSFGEGLIIQINGDLAKINFKGIGVKELMINIAPIQKI
ncbi:MAG: ATP-dependent helicase [Christensenellales bacterium]